MNLPASRAREASPPTESDLLASVPVPLVLIDADAKPHRANPAAEEMFNVSESALKERGWPAVLPPDSLVHAILAGAVAAGADFGAYDLEISLIAGRRLFADLLVAPVVGAPGWFVVNFQRRAGRALVSRQREQLGAAKTAIGVAAMLAHEIKNPLSGIRGAAQLLANEESGELTQLICTEVDRIRALVDSMEGFTDTRPLRTRPQNVHVILGHVRSLAQSAFGGGIAFEEDYDPSIPPVLGDRDALVQIFVNLVKNAAEACDEGGTVVMKTAYRHGLKIAVQGPARRTSVPIEICVVDSGRGVPAELADNLFDPFVTSKSAGTGLGLALVAKLVGDHGGLVEYERLADPARTLFRVLLPAADA